MRRAPQLGQKPRRLQLNAAKDVSQAIRAKSTRAEVRRLLGVEGNFGEKLGLSVDWAYQIIVQVGNYGESFDRNLGKESPIKLGRGLNDLWTEGGLMYAMPFR